MVLHGVKSQPFNSICIQYWWWPVSLHCLDFVSVFERQQTNGCWRAPPILPKKNLFFLLSFPAILLYRLCRCLKQLYAKLAHTFFHALSIPCVALGFLAVWDFHNLSDKPIPNFYTLHSWMGLVTMGLFALQFVFGFFTWVSHRWCIKIEPKKKQIDRKNYVWFCAGFWYACAVRKQHMDAVVQWFPCMQASVWQHLCWPLPLALLA